jgi:pSer/pThr/pTyr-binding forkhead associated (FHA) protein
MIRLEIDGRQYPVSTEWLVLGSADDCPIRLTQEGVLPRHALVKAVSDGSVAVHLGDPSAEVHVNGVMLGADPTPVLHGDKITIGSQDILVVETAKVGSTQHINVADLGALGVPAGPEVPVPLNPLTGGRLVCLTDGREYTVGEQGMFFGRDAVSDIVVTTGEVSRRHAQILPTPQGYVLNDSSTNGTFVNEERVEGSRVLIRADVLRIGGDEFRFYAEETQPAAPPPPEPPPPAAAPAPPRAATPPPGAAARLGNTMMGMPAFDPATLKPRTAHTEAQDDGSRRSGSGNTAGTKRAVEGRAVHRERAGRQYWPGGLQRRRRGSREREPGSRQAPAAGRSLGVIRPGVDQRDHRRWRSPRGRDAAVTWIHHNSW